MKGQRRVFDVALNPDQDKKRLDVSSENGGLDSMLMPARGT